MLRWLVGISVIIGLATTAGGQTTQPSPAAWTKAVADFAAAITSGDVDTARSMMSPDCTIRTFDVDRPTGMRQLLDFTTAQQMLGAHAYVQPAVGLAGDLANDVGKSDSAPSDAKKSLQLDDIDAQAKATTTAVHWLATSLKAEDGSLVGAIVLWDTNAVATSENPAHPVFVLIKGTTSDSGACTISRIVYGDPLQN